jgi:hypothetical protein
MAIHDTHVANCITTFFFYEVRIITTPLEDSLMIKEISSLQRFSKFKL